MNVHKKDFGWLDLANTKSIILNFHGVGSPFEGADPNELKYWWDESPFLRVLDNVVEANQEFPTSVAITFDDGNMSDASIALPALVNRGLKASFFVCSGRVGAEHYLDEQAIKDLLQAGMEIGSHGMLHTDWRTLSNHRLDEEVVGAKHRLEDICGREITKVAIPFGSYDRRVLSKIKSADFTYVFTSDGGISDKKQWIKARNTLNRSHFYSDCINDIKRRSSFINNIKRSLINIYKSAR